MFSPFPFVSFCFLNASLFLCSCDVHWLHRLRYIPRFDCEPRRELMFRSCLHDRRMLCGRFFFCDFVFLSSFHVDVFLPIPISFSPFLYLVCVVSDAPFYSLSIDKADIGKGIGINNLRKSGPFSFLLWPEAVARTLWPRAPYAWVTYKAWCTRLKLRSFACGRNVHVDDGADENESNLISRHPLSGHSLGRSRTDSA